MSNQQPSLGSLCAIKSGGTPPRARLEYFGGGIPWVKISDLLQGEINSTEESLTAAGIENSAASLLPAGTVLISIFATIGRTAILNIDAASNQAIAGIIPRDPEILVPKYLRYFLDSRRPVLERAARGVAQPNINQSILKALPIPLPSKTRQNQIVDLLSRAENIVRMRREAEAKAKEIVPALFVHGFGEHRSRNKGRREAVQVARWESMALGEVTDIQGGLQVTTKRADLPIETPYLRVANVHRAYIDLTEVKTIRLTVSELARTHLEIGDLLVVEGHGNPAEIGRVGIWPGGIDPCTHQNHLIRIRCRHGDFIPTYVWAYLNSAEGRQKLLRQGKTTSGLNTISVSNVKSVTVPRPPVQLQREFSARVADLAGLQISQSLATSRAEMAFQSLLAGVFGEKAT